MVNIAERKDIDTTASVCTERKKSVEDPSSIRKIVCLIESEKYSFLISWILNFLESLVEIYIPTNIPKLERMRSRLTRGIILKIFVRGISLKDIIKKVPRIFKRKERMREIVESIKSFFSLVTVYIINIDARNIPNRKSISILISYLLHSVKIVFTIFMSLMLL